MKVSIIGYGKMGKIRADAIETCGGTVVGVFDPNIKESEYKHYDTVDDLFNDSETTAVFICGPNFLNAPYSIRGMKSGKHVFCEKPPAVNVKELESVLTTEKSTNKKLMYGFNHRQHGSIIKIKEILDTKELGDILWMRGRYGKNVDEAFFSNWRADKNLSGGGILIDQGIHMLDLFLYMSGSFDKVQASVSNQFWKIDGIEDNVFTILENTKTGITASLHSTMTQWRHLFSLEIFLEGGSMILNGLKTPSGAYGEENLSVFKNDHGGGKSDEEVFRYPVDGSWVNEIEGFFNSIKEDTPIEIGNSRDAMEIMKLIEEIYENRK